MLVDANILLYAVDETSRLHQPARDWMEEQLNGHRRVGIPWQSLGAFLRISTHRAAAEAKLTPKQAWDQVDEWLAPAVAWVPSPGRTYGEILGDLIVRYELHGRLVPDGQLAALAIEHGLTVVSADSDFARFSELDWQNPVAP